MAKKISRKIFISSLILLVIISLGVGYLVGSLFGYSPRLEDSSEGLNNQSIDLFQNAYKKLKDNYIGEVDPEKFIYGAISGGYQSVDDPYTVFLPPELSEEFAKELSGELEGIGIRIGVLDEYPAVISPIKDSPADKAGLKPRDKIVKVGDYETKNKPIDTIVSKIRGPEGTTVNLEVLRGGETLNFEITREKIDVKTVEVEYLGDIAHVTINEFGAKTVTEFEDAVNDITQKNIDKVIIDLRSNPGGLLEDTVKVAGYLLEKDKLVVIEKTQDKEIEHRTEGPGTLKNAKLAVLVNEGSASAAEILAGAIRDQGRGVVIGHTTFGKGTVQQLEFLPGGGAVKITVAKWLTPDKDDIDKNGIEPDIIVDEADNPLFSKNDPVLDKAVENLSD